MQTSPSRQSRRSTFALVVVFALPGALVAACSGSDPPIATGGSTGKDSGFVPDTSGVVFDAAQYLDSSDGAPLVDGEASVDAIAETSTRDTSEPDTSGDDSGKVDVATLPDVASLDSAVPCGFLSCSPGCCTAAGECVAGNSDTACGANGAACQDCTSTTSQCQSFVCQ